jgi:EpsD family peptidyl-prolyl cis-trans isomerase
MKSEGAFTFSSCRMPAAIAAALLCLGLAACGGEKKDKPATQTAAKVNKEEITVHQINFVLQQQRNLKPEQTDAASKQVLERLIDQELAVQKATDMRIDRDPRVVQQLDAARREIVSRAYLEKLSDGAPKPAAEEVKRYYDEHPELFSDRHIYQLQELAIEAPPELVTQLKAKLAEAKNVAEFVDYLRAQSIKFTANQAVRAAEQLPLTTVPTFAKMRPGETVVNATPTGMQVIVMAGSQSQPVDEVRATPAIEQYLWNERKRRVIADDLKSLRAAAKVQYVGKFAGGASAPMVQEPVPVAPPPIASAVSIVEAPVAPASAAMDSATLNKGFGFQK